MLHSLEYMQMKCNAMLTTTEVAFDHPKCCAVASVCARSSETQYRTIPPVLHTVKQHAGSLLDYTCHGMACGWIQLTHVRHSRCVHSRPHSAAALCRHLQLPQA